MQQDILKEIHRWDHVLNFNFADPNFVHGNEDDPLEIQADEIAYESRPLTRQEAVGILHRAAAYLKYTRDNPWDNAALLLSDRKAKVEADLFCWEGRRVYV